MIIAGIDPSLTATGIAIIRDGHVIDYGREGWPGVSAASDLDRVRRVVALASKVILRVRSFNPDLVLIESPAYGSKLGSACDRNFLWGALVHDLGASRERTAYAGVAPRCREQFGAGKSTGDKVPVIDAVNRWWHLNLRTEPVSRRQDNEADAIVMATMGLARYQPDLVPFDLAPHQRKNLESVVWPILEVPCR